MAEIPMQNFKTSEGDDGHKLLNDGRENSNGNVDNPAFDISSNIDNSCNEEILPEPSPRRNHTEGEGEHSENKENESNGFDWDFCRLTKKARKPESEPDRYFPVIRVVFCIITFLFVFVSSVISKLTFILMTTNVLHSNNGLKNPNSALKYFINSKVSEIKVLWVWNLLGILTVPYIVPLLKCLYYWVFKKKLGLTTEEHKVKINVLVKALFIESLHCVGLGTFVLLVLPSFEPISACMLCFSVNLVPAVLKLYRTPKEKDEKALLYCYFSINGLSVACQFGSIGLWVYYVYITIGSINTQSLTLMVLVALSPILVSVTWREDFVTQATSTKPDDQSSGLQGNGNKRIHRALVGCLVIIWKIVNILFVVPLLLFGIFCKNGDACIKALYFQNRNGQLRFINNATMTEQNVSQDCMSYLPWIILLINIISNNICFKFANAACKILAQIKCFVLPVVFSTPIVILILFSHTEEISFGTCVLPMPVWKYIHEYPSDFYRVFDKYWVVIVAGSLGYFSFLLISNHVWIPIEERLVATERLFVQPFFNGAFLDQSLFLNKRRLIDEGNKKDEDCEAGRKQSKQGNESPMIYMCATMWHESEKEMIKILQSIFRQDKHQCTISVGPDYYNFEAHIFFDDAFKIPVHGDDGSRNQINGFVESLIRCIDTAASNIYGENVKITADEYITPYGERLEWTLPKGNTLCAHLKDKVKIRHRKRWSQVMYMYYLLPYKIINDKRDQTKSNVEEDQTMNDDEKLEKRREKAQNKFILALDGDVDFQPKAVQLLLDRMRKNPNVGAVCGRIHPIGLGPMVWYQQFEYAISHWLQKAAESKLGCVLCSPGCFSLFRGSALMDDNVLKKYTTPSTEARHYVQYDQGEDRWLCTLLLQQGHTIEYVAASDAKTYAPEGFYEFYNQRRRWSPSTMANIVELLMNWKTVTQKNKDITKLYILYQAFLLLCSILTPGTIFLMILEAILMTFPSLPHFVTVVINVALVFGLVILCFVANTNVQLAYAAVVSIIYSLVMIVVLVELIKEMVAGGLCSVTTIFFIFIVGGMVVAALLHPVEMSCLVRGALYFIAIPSMSMLLMIYSLCNLHVVSWGTRDTRETTSLDDKRAQKDKNQNRLIRRTVGGETSENTSFGRGFLRYLCCLNTSVLTEGMGLMESRIDDIESRITADSCDSTSEKCSKNDSLPPSESNGRNPGTVENARDVNDERNGHFWMNIRKLNDKENKFWKEIITKYLQPLEENKEKRNQVRKDLIQLRNKVCLALILLNALFVLLVYLLIDENSNTSQSLSVPLPCTVSNGRPGEGYIEPLSVTFTAIFGIMFLLQFICMLFHRFSTVMHIAASTEIGWRCSNKSGNETETKEKQTGSQTSKSTCDQTLPKEEMGHGEDSSQV